MKIGYTTGVFDLFHIGHLNIIKKARENCDYLIVGVSTDELVSEYKGKKPVIKYEERVQIIEALKYVDKVVEQSTLDKYDAWKKYHFNIIFHGDDWKNTELYQNMEKKLMSEGVEIQYFSRTKGISSTELKKIIYQYYNDKYSE